MAVLNSGLDTAWEPEDYGKLVDIVLAEKSIAFQAGTVVSTSSETIRFPMLTADPAVAWTPENTQISLQDPTTDELVITPKKVAGLTQISNEAAEDSNPAVADQVGRSLARSIAKKVDAAFFANTTSNGPSGLQSVAYTDVDSAGVITGIASLDLFHDAKKIALDNNARLTHWLVSPAVALQIAKLKVLTTGSNQNLLPSVDDGVQIAGLQILVSTDVDASTFAWGVDASQIMVVQRTGTRVVRSSESVFDYDAIQVRATARVSWGFANPDGIVRIYDVTP